MPCLYTKLCITFLTLSLFYGCESPVDVFSEADAPFSVYGFLDASADTQWIRVESLQDSLLTGSAELDAVLTSTHQSSGQQTVWKDSLFQYVNDFQAYNFWTTSPFSPSETYVLEIMRSDGALTSLTVTLPNVFPSPEFNVFPFSLINLPVSGNVCAREFDFNIDIDILAALEITYVLPTSLGMRNSFSFSYIPRAQKLNTGSFTVNIEWVRDLKEIAALETDISLRELLQLEEVSLLLAAADPNWPDNNLDNETVALPGVTSVVNNGYGYVGGIVSKTVQIPIGDFRDESCFR